MASIRPCPICGSRRFHNLISFGKMPLCAHQYRSPAQKDIFHEGTYLYCDRCRFVQIRKLFSLEHQYSSFEYFSSSLFPPYVRQLADEVYRVALKHKGGFLLEIGSNDGGFLGLVRGKGFRRVVGVEASRVLARHAAADGIETLNRFFTFRTAKEIKRRYGLPGVIVSRFVLEHVWDAEDFLSGLKLLAAEGAEILIEIPDLDQILRRRNFTGFWDQHVNYFNLRTMQELFAKHGLHLQRYSLDNSRFEQTILAWFGTKPRKVSYAFGRTPARSLKQFKPEVGRILTEIRRKISALKRSGARIAVYGAAHIPTNVINYSGIGKFLEYSVDKDQRKHGRYLPGSRLKVMPPEFLDKDRPDYCLIAAVGNERKILSQHGEYLCRGGKFIRLFPFQTVNRPV